MPPKQKNNSSKQNVSRNNPPHNSYKRTAFIFSFLAILIILGVSYLTLSQVTIILTPTNKPITHKFNLQINSADTHQENDLPNLTGQIIIKAVDINQTFPISQGKKIDAIATGKVTLYNQRPVAQTLVATTRLLSPQNILFRLKNKVTIPANSSLETEVYADQPGVQSNIEATTFTIPGLSTNLQKLVYAKSIQPMSGGTKTIGVLTQKEITTAKEKIRQQSAADLLSKYIDNQDNLTLIGTQIDDSQLKTDQTIGTETDKFNLSGQIIITAVLANRNRLLDIAKEQFKKNPTLNNKFVNINPSSLNYRLISIKHNPLSAIAEISLSGITTLNNQQNIFNKNMLIGFTADDIKLYFSQFDSIKNVEVKFSPFWVKKVPLLKNHIHIKIAQ